MNKYEIVSEISRITTTYLAKLGVLVCLRLEDDLIYFERIDEPEQVALDMELCFIPKKLNSDEEALEIVFAISDITLDDETITTNMREIIIEDCYNLIALH